MVEAVALGVLIAWPLGYVMFAICKSLKDLENDIKWSKQRIFELEDSIKSLKQRILELEDALEKIKKQDYGTGSRHKTIQNSE